MNQANKQAAKVALVTGGARRIGAAIVKALHQEGYTVVIHCRDSIAEAHALAVTLNEQRSNTCYVLPQELTAPVAAETIIQSILEWTGRLDLVVNNASLFIKSDLNAESVNEWDSLFTMNVQVPYLISLSARAALSKTQGAIINITDIHAKTPLKGYEVYCQTKAALDMQTKALARAFAPDIRVNAVAPGAIAWPEDTNSLSNAEQEKIIAKTPLKKHGDPHFIAQAVIALVNNPFITGQILAVDGGRSA